MELRNYQIEGIECFKKSKYGLLVTLKPGTGKSLIMYKIIEDSGYPVLVITLPHIIYEHSPNVDPNYFIIDTVNCQIPKDKKIYFISPTLFKFHELFLLNIPFKLICIDESHMYANWNSQQTKAIVRFSMHFRGIKKLLMSGTPCAEGEHQLQPQMEILSKTILGDSTTFRARYIKTIFIKGFYKDILLNKQEILKRVKPYIFTRDVPMPTQIIKHINVPLPDKLSKIYELFLKEATIYYEDKELLFTDALWLRLYQICLGYTVDLDDNKKVCILDTSRYEIIADIVKNINSQVIVWGNFIPELDMLKQYVNDNARLVRGDTPKKEKIIESFKKGEFKTLIANPDCVGAGISLQNCAYQVYSSLPFSGVNFIQSITRTNRINQTQQEFIYFCYYQKTMQEKLTRKVLCKPENLKKIIANILREN